MAFCMKKNCLKTVWYLHFSFLKLFYFSRWAKYSKRPVEYFLQWRFEGKFYQRGKINKKVSNNFYETDFFSFQFYIELYFYSKKLWYI